MIKTLCKGPGMIQGLPSMPYLLQWIFKKNLYTYQKSFKAKKWHGIRLHMECEKSGFLRRWDVSYCFCSINRKSMDYHLQLFFLGFVNLTSLIWERIMCKWLPHPARIHLKVVICQTGWNQVFWHRRKYWYLLLLYMAASSCQSRAAPLSSNCKTNQTKKPPPKTTANENHWLFPNTVAGWPARYSNLKAHSLNKIAQSYHSCFMSILTSKCESPASGKISHFSREIWSENKAGSLFP